MSKRPLRKATVGDVLDAMEHIRGLEDTIDCSYTMSPGGGGTALVALRVWRYMVAERVGLFQRSESIVAPTDELIFSCVLRMANEAYWEIYESLYDANTPRYTARKLRKR